MAIPQLRMLRTNTESQTEPEYPLIWLRLNGSTQTSSGRLTTTARKALRSFIGRILTDARLPKCVPGPIDSWELRKPKLDAGSAAGALLDAVAALGGTQSEDTVTFTPPLTFGSPCTTTVLVAVPVKSKLKLKAKARGDATDGDALVLDCRP